MNDSADVYDSTQTQHEQTVRMATVESVRRVAIDADRSAPFGAFGGGRGSLLTSIIGGIAGAVVGNEVQGRLERQNGLEITVRLANGDLRAITQADDGQMFRAGQRVRLLSSGGVMRVTV